MAWDTDQASFLQEQPGVFWRQRRYSDQTAHEIDLAVRSHVEAARARAVGILRDNREALDEGPRTRSGLFRLNYLPSWSRTRVTSTRVPTR